MIAIDRDEFIADIPFTANRTLQLPTNGGLIPNDRYLSGLRLMFTGRYKAPAANLPTAANADGVSALINRVTVRGTHRARRQQETIIDLRGPDLYQLNRVYQGAAPALSPSPLVYTAGADNDIRFCLDVPFVPLGVSPQQQGLYLLDAPNYDSLRLDVQFGDETSILTMGTGAGAFTAYGGATGAPKVAVHGLFALDGSARKFAGYVPARCVRYFTEVSNAQVTTTSTNGVRLYNFDKGFGLRAVMLKTGVKATCTAGLDAYVSLSDSVLSNIKINLGLNRPIRWLSDFHQGHANAIKNHGLAEATGFCKIDFAQTGALDLALDTSGLTQGPTGDTDLYVAADTTAAAGQAVNFIVEELRYRAGRVSGARR